MDGNANHVGAVPSTTKVRLGHLVTSVPEDRREAVYIMVSEVLLEAVQRAPIPVNTGSEAVAVIATFVPAASLSAPIPQAVRTTFQDVISAIVPRNVILGHNADGAGAGVMGGGAQITVETTEAKEVREKQITVAGIKMPRRSESTYTWMYAHHWLCPEGTVEKWHRLYNTFTKDQKLSEILQLKHRMFIKNIETWFELSRGFTPDNIPANVLLLFVNNITLLLEEMLLGGVSLAGTAAVATLTFASCLAERLHAGTALDYHEDLRKARSAKEAPKSLFR